MTRSSLSLMIALGCCSVVGAPTAKAMSFISLDRIDNTLIMAQGKIELGDDERLHAFIGGLRGPVPLMITLDSLGGNVHEAALLASTIRKSALTTGVAGVDTCASACFLVFSAGVRRLASVGARIGIMSETGSNTATATFATTFARVAANYGVSPAVIGKLALMPSGGMIWLTVGDLRSMGVEVFPNRSSSPTDAAPYSGSEPPPAPAPSRPARSRGKADLRRSTEQEIKAGRNSN